jgi:hypothetical protein
MGPQLPVAYTLTGDVVEGSSRRTRYTALEWISVAAGHDARLPSVAAAVSYASAEDTRITKFRVYDKASLLEGRLQDGRQDIPVTTYTRLLLWREQVAAAAAAAAVAAAAVSPRPMALVPPPPPQRQSRAAQPEVGRPRACSGGCPPE